MVISERVAEDVTILDLSGPLIIGNATTLLQQRIDGLVERQTRHVVLNLAEVPNMDSSGLGQLLRGQLLLSRMEGSLRLVNVGPSVHRTLQVTRVLSRLEVLDSEDAVLGGTARSAEQ